MNEPPNDPISKWDHCFQRVLQLAYTNTSSLLSSIDNDLSDESGGGTTFSFPLQREDQELASIVGWSELIAFPPDNSCGNQYKINVSKVSGRPIHITDGTFFIRYSNNLRVVGVTCECYAEEPKSGFKFTIDAELSEKYTGQNYSLMEYHIPYELGDDNGGVFWRSMNRLVCIVNVEENTDTESCVTENLVVALVNVFQIERRNINTNMCALK